MEIMLKYFAEKFRLRYDLLNAELMTLIGIVTDHLLEQSPGLMIDLKGRGITVGTFDPLLNGCPELEAIILLDGEVWAKLESQEKARVADLYNLSFLDNLKILCHLEKEINKPKSSSL